jgi:hypothetical protein
MLAVGCAHKEAAQKVDIPVISPPAADHMKENISTSVDSARDAVLDYFVPADGNVEAAEYGLVKVRFRGKSQLKRGMRFSVYREGDPFYHPVTNELIGYAEDFVGRIELSEDADDAGLFSCTAVSGDMRAGDKVRISSSRIKIAFFQDRRANWPVSEAFYIALKDSGRFEIVESYTPDYEAGTLSKIAGDLGAEAALMFSTSVKERKRQLNVKLYWAEDAKVFGEISKEADKEVMVSFAPEEEFIARTFEDTEPWRRYVLPGGQLIAMGDIDDNGISEIVISDGRNIRIYSAGEDIQELWNIQGEGEGDHLSLDVFDVNGNGRSEIFVTSVVNAGDMNTSDGIIAHGKDSYSGGFRVNSFVLEYDPSEGYKRIEENMPYFLRVSGETLLMQSFHGNNIFDGPVYQGEWEDMHYKPAEPLEIPDKVNIYGFTFVDWKNEGQVDLITYNEKGYLNLYDNNGNLKWESDESFGPFVFRFESSTVSATGSTVKWSVRSRLSIVRTERGLEVIAVNREPVLRNVPGLGTYKADIYSLWWDGAVMNKELILKDVAGAVTDQWIQGRELFLLAKGGIYSFIGNLTEGEFSRGSILYYYNFSPLETTP